jgi:hypothetical protein
MFQPNGREEIQKRLRLYRALVRQVQDDKLVRHITDLIARLEQEIHVCSSKAASGGGLFSLQLQNLFIFREHFLKFFEPRRVYVCGDL